MPEVKDEQGNVIAKLPYTEKGETQAEDMVKENQGWKVTNAPDARESYQFGGIPGQPGFGQRQGIRPPLPGIRPPLPGTRPPLPGTGTSIGMYDKGGEVEKKNVGRSFEDRMSGPDRRSLKGQAKAKKKEDIKALRKKKRKLRKSAKDWYGANKEGFREAMKKKRVEARTKKKAIKSKYKAKKKAIEAEYGVFKKK